LVIETSLQYDARSEKHQNTAFVVTWYYSAILPKQEQVSRICIQYHINYSHLTFTSN